jgi:hypothetical protein
MVKMSPISYKTTCLAFLNKRKSESFLAQNVNGNFMIEFSLFVYHFSMFTVTVYESAKFKTRKFELDLTRKFNMQQAFRAIDTGNSSALYAD